MIFGYAPHLLKGNTVIPQLYPPTRVLQFKKQTAKSLTK